jgi:hypothetical protein
MSMIKSVADVSVTAESSMDKWLMDRVPWALWFCLAGLVVILHADSRGVNGAAIAGVYLALLALAFAGWAAATLIERSGYPFHLVFPIVFLIAFLVAVRIAAFGSVGRYAMAASGTFPLRNWRDGRSTPKADEGGNGEIDASPTCRVCFRCAALRSGGLAQS